MYLDFARARAYCKKNNEQNQWYFSLKWAILTQKNVKTFFWKSMLWFETSGYHNAGHKTRHGEPDVVVGCQFGSPDLIRNIMICWTVFTILFEIP